MPCRVHFRTRVLEEHFPAGRCKARPNHLFNPTLDRSVVSLPLQSSPSSAAQQGVRARSTFGWVAPYPIMVARFGVVTRAYRCHRQNHRARGESRVQA